MTYITDLRQFPNKRSYAIVTGKTTLIPGDERSRTAPGHGYPAHQERTVELQVFESEEAWKKQIAKLESPPSYSYNREYRAFIIEPVSVKTEIVVEVE